jgi:hypothetical protein
MYGHFDQFYPMGHSRNNFTRFQNAGGQGTFLEFTVPGGNGHAVRDAPELWQGPVDAYLRSLPDNTRQ